MYWDDNKQKKSEGFLHTFDELVNNFLAIHYLILHGKKIETNALLNLRKH